MLCFPFLPIFLNFPSINFRDGPNQVFQDAVAEMISLAGSTPKYLHSLGLISDQEFKEDGEEADINFLMNQVCQILLCDKTNQSRIMALSIFSCD